MTAEPADAAPRSVLIVCGDLLTGGPLVQAVRQAGLTPTRALSGAKADPANAVGVVLDLSLPGALEWLSERPADGPPTLSFGPHVHAELLKTARAAGRGPVLTRSQLADGLPAWLATL
ncbi:response regulator [Alienimonas californiensis]|uniref:Uncharacterized protein n=1 Tax=Alienimonas californiensis TaxID=2527989 RepID=A0A517PC95_9PLAN|nr:hypothetical protein [Alienimonas californiensis]QDT17008.1 hypothetical protein CA12_31180 [Alienimonas californiensis]